MEGGEFGELGEGEGDGLRGCESDCGDGGRLGWSECEICVGRRRERRVGWLS